MKTKRPSSKRAKHYLKLMLRRKNIPIIAKHGRLFVVPSTVNFACIRYYGWSVIRENHPSLDKMILEHTKPMKHHGLWDF